MQTLNYPDELSGIEVSYGPGDHRGADEVVISVVENGGWKTVAVK